MRKVEPLFKAVAEYSVWITGLRREQARAARRWKSGAMFTLPGGKQVLKLAPLAEWTTRDVWYACEQFAIPSASVCTRRATRRSGANHARRCRRIPTIRAQAAGRGRKVECGIHIEAAPASWERRTNERRQGCNM